jgi:uncharacterized protein (DUF433 family)
MPTLEAINHISLDAGGVAWVRGKKVKVLEIVQDHLAYGWSADAIHEQHPDLSLAEVHSALAFYYDHPAEMEKQLAGLGEGLKKLRATTGESSLQKRLSTRAKAA